MTNMLDINMLSEYLPLILPLLVAQIALWGFAIYHILTHNSYKRGNRILWVVLSFINFIGPILYFVLGKEDS